MSLLQRWMPEHDVAAAYGTTIRAPAPLVYATLLNTDIGRLPIVRVLMSLRSIPGLLFSPRETLARIRNSASRPPLKLKSVLRGDFALLEELPDSEIVMGLTGSFWTPTGTLIPTDPATFHDLPPAGMARAAWNFAVTATGATTRLTTETRVRCSDAATTRRFRRYWAIVAPGSGIIRWAILRRVRRDAERAAVS